ncbi:hypothetical protein [Amphritea balenae]|uniref:Uncharacterized protein n=1 Tax=Amphritea balenae TaxID=452629 RepID=A0A3P1SJ36_9GAMM|nr:hypothetical protein [Amphritea balenae]RRC96980.1 hypothetical protein EHS89_19785 [Amphritea balenae]GGK85133.1 hypothetical protein GCM10007941_39560 [Amphritea balenae]
MIRIVQLCMLSLLLALPLSGINTDRLSEAQAAPSVASLYDVTPYWKQAMSFPRWEDTYVVVFEQEMLA